MGISINVGKSWLVLSGQTIPSAARCMMEKPLLGLAYQDASGLGCGQFITCSAQEWEERNAFAGSSPFTPSFCHSLLPLRVFARRGHLSILPNWEGPSRASVYPPRYATPPTRRLALPCFACLTALPCRPSLTSGR